MPAVTDPQSAAHARAQRAGKALSFAGVLSRASVSMLWKQLPALDGVRTLDLHQVVSIDSAGLALLAEIAARVGVQSGSAPAIQGAPEGLAELRSAYRLDGSLGYGIA